jgi:TRAP-type mannitol/chloroaromatic compound transport system permease large subunit
MTDPQIAVSMLGIFLLTIFLGFPICFTLMAMGVGFGYYAYYDPGRMQTIFDNRIFDLFVNQTYSVMANDVLTAVPLFLFMGYIVERANIVTRLFDTLYISARRLPGAMAVAALATCALFATATGIVGAVVTLMGLLAFPAMLRAKYDTSFASGVICAGGCLGILIPPSIMLIVYAATSNVSIVRLYAGAMVPGFLLAGLYMTYVIGRAWLSPHLAPRPKDEDIRPYEGDPRLLWAVNLGFGLVFAAGLGLLLSGIFANVSWAPAVLHSTIVCAVIAALLYAAIWRASGGHIIFMLVTSFFPMAILILSVLGAILFGLATPSEAASVGALGGLVLAACYRALTWQRLRESVYLTVRTSAMVCWLFVGSWTFSSVFSYLGGEQLISEFVIGLDLSPITFLIIAQIIIFLLGWPLEWSEIIIIFVPIFLPLLPHFGIDPLFFGILVALNLQTSFMTPPMAMAAYYLKGVSPPHVQLTQIFKGSFPFLAMGLLAMVLLYTFPGITFWLPELLYGR